MKTVKVVLVRHGESEWNKNNLFCGWYNADLTENGKRDATKITAMELKKHCFEFDLAYASALKRTQLTLDVIKDELNCAELPSYYDWHLNERHYGNLTGFNKREIATLYGEEQVQIWRRSYEIAPPPITPANPYYNRIRENPNLYTIPDDQFPDCESLKTVSDRVIPFWKNDLLPQIMRGTRLLIVSHGTVLRAIIKHLENISNTDIASINIPNSIPCVYEINTVTGKPVGKLQFLADEDALNKAMKKTAAIGK